MTIQFDRTAEAVTERIADLLAVRTCVVDTQGVVVASSEPSLVGLPFEHTSCAGDISYLQVPLRRDGQSASVMIGEPLNGDFISPRLAQVLVELVINQTATQDRRPSHHELKNQFIHDLLHGLLEDETIILRQARLLGMDFGPPRAVLLIDATDYIFEPTAPGQPEAIDAQVRRRAQLVIGSIVGFFHLPNDTICAYIGDGEVAVLKASNTRNLATWAEGADLADPASASWANLAALRRAGKALLNRLRAETSASISIGIGRHHPGIHGFARSYQDARAALALGRRFHGMNAVHCLDRLGIAAFVGVSDEQTKIELATYLLSPLDHEPDLFETLRAFFTENCNPSPTAQRLAIHRNTLSYRLDKIASLIGLDPRRFDDAVQIRLSLLLRSFRVDAA